MNDEPVAVPAADHEAAEPGAVPRAPDARLASAKDPIALGLRRLWAGVEQEAVPEDFFRILDDIDARATEADPAANRP